MASSLRQKNAPTGANYAEGGQDTLGTSDIPWKHLHTVDITAKGDVVIQGDLQVVGDATQVNVDQLSVDESMIRLAKVNTGTAADIGLVGAEDTAGTPVYLGFVRDADNDQWKTFENLNSDPLTGTTVDFSSSSLGTINSKFVTPESGLTIGSTPVTSTAAEINKLDRTANDGVAEASKAVILDENKDLTGMRDLTITGTVTAASITAGSIVIEGNSITTASGDAPSFSDVEITGGSIDATVIGGTTAAAGSFTTLDASDAVTLNANVTLGDNATDQLTFTGRLVSDVLPLADSLRSLGSDTLRWAHTYSDEITASTIHAFTAGGAIDFNNQVMTQVDIDSGSIDATTIGAASASSAKFTTLNASGETTLDGAVTLGNATGDDITVTGRLASSIVPKVDGSHTLGTSALRMAHVYSDQVTASTIHAFTAGGAIDFNNVAMTNVDINSGAIDATTIGGTTAAAANVTQLDVSSTAQVDGVLTLSAGDGALTFDADNSSIKIPDNKPAALVVEQADEAYLTFVTSDSAEKVVTNKLLDASQGITLAADEIETVDIKDKNVTLAKIEDVAQAKILIGPTGGGTLAEQTITGDIALSSLGVVTIQPLAVETGMLDNDAVTAAKLADNAVVTANIVDANVTTAKVQDSAITTAKINDAAVTTAKLADDNVTLAKMADLARGSLIYGNATDDPTALARGAANTVLGSDGTDISYVNVTSAMIADSTIVDGDISASAQIAHSKLANVTSAQILVGNASNVPTAVSVTGDINIDNAGVTTIQASAVETSMIANDAVTLAKMDSLARGSLIHGNASNDPTALVKGDADTVLSSDGTDISYTKVATAMVADDAITLDKLAGLTGAHFILGDSNNDPAAQQLSGDISVSDAGVVSISSGVIVNADINANAAIVDTKLATIATANKVSGSAVQLAATTAIEDATGLKLKTALAGAGLGITGQVLSVNVDDSSIQIDSDTLKVKALGVTNAMLEGSIANAKLVNDHISISAATITSEIDLGSTITYAAGRATDVSIDGSTVTYSAQLASDSNQGVAQFSSDDFDVTAGTVTVKDLGVSNAQLEGSIANSKLVNSSVNLAIGSGLTGSASVALGATASIDLSLDSTLTTVDGDLTIASNAVDLARLQQISQDQVFGRTDTGTGNVQLLSIGTHIQAYDAKLQTLSDSMGATAASSLAALTSDEIFVLDAVVPGTASASKALVVDASRDIDNLNEVTAVKFTDGSAELTNGTLTATNVAATAVYSSSGNLTVSAAGSEVVIAKDLNCEGKIIGGDTGVEFQGSMTFDTDDHVILTTSNKTLPAPSAGREMIYINGSDSQITLSVLNTTLHDIYSSGSASDTINIPARTTVRLIAATSSHWYVV